MRVLCAVLVLCALCLCSVLCALCLCSTWAACAACAACRVCGRVSVCLCPDVAAHRLRGGGAAAPRQSFRSLFTQRECRTLVRCVVQTSNPGHQLLLPPAECCVPCLRPWTAQAGARRGRAAGRPRQQPPSLTYRVVSQFRLSVHLPAGIPCRRLLPTAAGCRRRLTPAAPRAAVAVDAASGQAPRGVSDAGALIAVLGPGGATVFNSIALSHPSAEMVFRAQMAAVRRGVLGSVAPKMIFGESTPARLAPQALAHRPRPLRATEETACWWIRQRLHHLFGAATK